MVVRTNIKTSSRKRENLDKKDHPKDNNSSSSDSTKSGNYVNVHVEKTSSTEQSSTNKKKNRPACNNESCTKIAKKFKDLNRYERTLIVKEQKLCTRCLGGHHFFRCRFNFTCKVDGCKLKHHTLLHDYDKTTDSSSKIESSSKARDDEKELENSMNKFSCNANHFNVASEPTKQRVDKFRIVPAHVSYNGMTIKDFAYYDDGSNVTSMESSLADELNVNGTSSHICVEWALGYRHTFNSKIVSVRIARCYDGAEEFELNNVRTVALMSSTYQRYQSHSHCWNNLII